MVIANCLLLAPSLNQFAPEMADDFNPSGRLNQSATLSCALDKPRARILFHVCHFGPFGGGWLLTSISSPNYAAVKALVDAVMVT
jgi:hypothetical protein